MMLHSKIERSAVECVGACLNWLSTDNEPNAAKGVVAAVTRWLRVELADCDHQKEVPKKCRTRDP